MGNVSLLANRRLRVNSNKCVLIKRTLEGTGSLTVIRGVQVFPNDILGTSAVTGGFSSINLAHDLGVGPRDGMKYIQRPIGQKFFRGELLALRKTMFSKKVITAPTDCILESYDSTSGLIRLKYLSTTKPLISGVYGIIEQVNIPYGEVLIKTMVTEIWGVLGIGTQRIGFLNIIGKQGELTSEDRITHQMKGQIVIGGGLFFGGAIKKAVQYGLAGIVCGGINSNDFRAMKGSIYQNKQIYPDVGVSLMVTEGLGAVPIGNDIFSQISNHQGKFVLLDGNMKALWLPSDKSDSILTASKITLPVNNTPIISEEPTVTGITLGVNVRIIRQPFIGIQGKVTDIDQTPTYLESGISTYLLTIETPSRKIKVPYTNIEII